MAALSSPPSTGASGQASFKDGPACAVTNGSGDEREGELAHPIRGETSGRRASGAKDWGWGGGIKAYVPKTAGSDESQMSHPPTPMTGGHGPMQSGALGAKGEGGQGMRPACDVRKGGAAEGLGIVSGKRYINLSEDEAGTGWGSDVSSEGEPPHVVVDPYDEDPFAHVFSSEAAPRPADDAQLAQSDSKAETAKERASGEGAEDGGMQRGSGGVAEGFEAEAARLEMEASALKEAARIAEEQVSCLAVLHLVLAGRIPRLLCRLAAPRASWISRG